MKKLFYLGIFIGALAAISVIPAFAVPFTFFDIPDTDVPDIDIAEYFLGDVSAHGQDEWDRDQVLFTISKVPVPF